MNDPEWMDDETALGVLSQLHRNSTEVGDSMTQGSEHSLATAGLDCITPSE